MFKIGERKLVYIPMVHYCLEKRETIEAFFGKDKVNHYFTFADDFWKRVFNYIREIDIKIDKIFLEGWTGTQNESKKFREIIGENATIISDDEMLKIVMI